MSSNDIDWAAIRRWADYEDKLEVAKQRSEQRIVSRSCPSCSGYGNIDTSDGIRTCCVCRGTGKR